MPTNSTVIFVILPIIGLVLGAFSWYAAHLRNKDREDRER